jgi:hypothetical protein
MLRFPLIHPPLLAVCVATGDDRLCANLLLTVGFIAPR